MFNDKQVFGMTGPSVFSPEIQVMIEKFFGGIPMYIGQNNVADLEFPLAHLDALVLAGGNDIFPGSYGQQVTHGNSFSKFDILRDKRELFLVKRCVELGKPILAICRGFQLVCVNYGFHLMPDINGGSIVHSPGEIKIDLESGGFMHYINTVKGENSFGLAPDKRYKVNSFHHQAVFAGNKADWLENQGLKILATSDTEIHEKNNTKIAELAEHPEHKIVACQWHPEADWEYGNHASTRVLTRFKQILG